MQCKAFGTKGKKTTGIGPNLIRELEGAFVGAPAGWRGEGVVGVFVCPVAQTEGVRRAMRKSRWPLCWVGVEYEDVGEEEGGDGQTERKGRVSQVSWNEAARGVGLEGMGVTLRYSGEGERIRKEAVLTWDGKVVLPVEEEDAISKTTQH